MKQPMQLPGFSVDLDPDDDKPAPGSRLAQLAAGLDLTAPRPSKEELKQVEEAGERIGFSKREPQPIAAKKTAIIEKAPKVEKILTLRLNDDVKTRFQDMCYARGRNERINDTLTLMMDAFEWAQANGWKGQGGS